MFCVGVGVGIGQYVEGGFGGCDRGSGLNGLVGPGSASSGGFGSLSYVQQYPYSSQEWCQSPVSRYFRTRFGGGAGDGEAGEGEGKGGGWMPDGTKIGTSGRGSECGGVVLGRGGLPQGLSVL